MTKEQLTAKMTEALLVGNTEEATTLAKQLHEMTLTKDIAISSETPIYDTLKANASFPITDQKKKCIEESVEQLLEEGPQSEEPGLLLGKIQCGKTDTFENIIGLAFDKGIDIAVVFTKGTKPLAEQTKMRMKKDYRFFKASDDNSQANTIEIHDIMEIWRNLTPARVDGCKTVIVCKKEATNLKHLIDLFSKNKYAKHFCKKRVLIIDDEADFASRNYRAVKLSPVNDDETGIPIEQEKETTMAKISQQIDDFRKLPEFCRYLQVTATPYCLYLQPQGELFLNGNKVMPFKPRFTSIVPIHDKYIGGKQYFEDSQNENSMYSHLFHQVDQKCLDVMGHEDKRYLNNSIASGNLYGLTYALISYLMGTAVRKIQREAEGKKFRSSALIHVELDKRNHDWQKRVIDRLLCDIEKCIVNEDNSDPRISNAIDAIYKDFEEANQKGRNEGFFTVQLPEKQRIINEIAGIFTSRNVHPQIVNSDEQIVTLLDEESGELRLDHIANIFIGGNILDRGITIKNMLCFFYGRNPKNFQQDTVLQHARMYGARDKEDMAVTRLHTTAFIYKILVRMNELDNQLRQWFIDGKDKEEPNAVFVGFDKNIKPCASQKIKASNALILKAQKRIVPAGFWTGTRKEISKTVEEIDTIITCCPGYNYQDENGFFEMDKNTAFKILNKIRSTYIYDNNHFNRDRKSDIDEMLCALEYCTSKSDNKLWALHRTDRNMKRIRENGGYVDAPDDGRTDVKPSRDIAVDRPVLMLLRQNGEKVIDENGNNVGWNNTPFYWPVVMTQQNIGTVMFALEQKSKEIGLVNDISEVLAGLNPDEVIDMTYAGGYRGSMKDHFGDVGTEYGDGDECAETRALKETTASKYILKDEDGKWKINTSVVSDPDSISSVYSYNNGIFPFVLRPYKYMLLRSGRDASADVILLELKDMSQWGIGSTRDIDEDGNLIDRNTNSTLVNVKDILINRDLSEEEVYDEDVCQWIIFYTIKRVLKYKALHPTAKESEE